MGTEIDISDRAKELTAKKGIGYHQSQGRSQGGKGGNPPETEKIVVEKMVLFPKALFLVTNFQKIKIFNFSIEFSSKNFKIFSKFPNNLCFSSKRAKN